MQPCQGDAVFLDGSKSTLFGLLKVDAYRNHWETQQHNPNVRICATHFMDDRLMNLRLAA